MRRTLTFGALVLLALPLLAPAPAVAQELPPAEELIEQYLEAIGGRDAHLAVESMRTRGSFSMPAMGLEGGFVMEQAQPDRMVMTMSLPQIGEVRTGFDGEVGWALNPMIGPSVMQGDELRQTAEQSSILATVKDRSIIPGRETVERAEYGGEACWKVRLTWRSGRESYDCYSVESGLLVASEATQASAMGEIGVVIRYSDYESFGGLLFPTRMSQETMGQQQVMTIDEVEFNLVPDAAFELPDPIRTLIEGDL